MLHAMNITLAADLAAFVQLKLDGGRYHSASQVLYLDRNVPFLTR